MRKLNHSTKVIDFPDFCPELQNIPWYKKWLSYFWMLHLERRSSDYNPVLDVDLYFGKLRLDSKRANYSFGLLENVMRNALEKASARQCEMNHVLMLGYGGGSAAKVIHDEFNPAADITAVEIDPVVAELAEKWFYTKNVKLQIADALEFVPECKQKFDLIICDVFIDVDVPGKTTTKAFYEQLFHILEPNGVVFQNLMISKPRAEAQFLRFSQVFRETDSWRLHGFNTIFMGVR